MRSDDRVVALLPEHLGHGDFGVNGVLERFGKDFKVSENFRRCGVVPVVVAALELSRQELLQASPLAWIWR